MRSLALIVVLLVPPAKRTHRPDPPPKPRPTLPSPTAPAGPLPGDRQAMR